MFDFLSMLEAMSTEVESDGKTWIVIGTVGMRDNGSYKLVVESGIETPAPVHVIFVPKQETA